MAEIATICPYCGCGCGLYLHVVNSRVVGTAPMRVHPVSQGRLCLKGWHAHELSDSPDRLTRPLVRRGGELHEASWEEAVSEVVRGLQGVVETAGPQAVGVLGSARCSNEDNYLLARFARAVIGTSNLDSSLAAYSLPERIAEVGDAQIADLDDSDLIILVGVELGEEEPAVGAHVYRALQRGTRLITASVRQHSLAHLAQLHLPVRPGGEAAALGSLLHELVVERKLAGDADVSDLTAALADLKPAGSEAKTGLAAAAVREAADLYQAAEKVVLVFSSALASSPEGTRALSVLRAFRALGAGPRVALLGLLGRCNLYGCWDMGVRHGFLPGAPTGDMAAAGRLKGIWGDFNSEAGLPAWGMMDQCQALYVMGDDPSRNLPDWAARREKLESMRLLVVQDLFMSPLAELAHVVLPAASFAEKDGTVTNLEGRVQLVRAAVASPGEAREDWRIIAELSRAFGKALSYQTAADIFAEIAQAVPAYAGLSHDGLKAPGGGQTSRPGAAKADEGAAAALRGAEGAVEADEQFPLVLVADATLGPWAEEVSVSHMPVAGREFTVMSKDYPDGMLILNPADGRKNDLRPGRAAEVASANGAGRMQVKFSEDVPEGVAVTPYHHAARHRIMNIVTEPDTGRPLFVPTPVSVGVGK